VKKRIEIADVKVGGVALAGLDSSLLVRSWPTGRS